MKDGTGLQRAIEIFQTRCEKTFAEDEIFLGKVDKRRGLGISQAGDGVAAIDKRIRSFEENFIESDA